jgi:PAS domain S-box-containing protein
MTKPTVFRNWLERGWARFRGWGVAASANEQEIRQVVLRNTLMAVLSTLGMAWLVVWVALEQWAVLAVLSGMMGLYLGFWDRLNGRPAFGAWVQWLNLLFLWVSTTLFADLLGPGSTAHLWLAFAGTTALVWFRGSNYLTWGLQSLISLALATLVYLYPHTFFDAPPLSGPQETALTLGAQLTLFLVISSVVIAEREAHRWAATQADHAQRVQQQQALLLGRIEQDRAEVSRNLLALLDGSAAMLLLIDCKGQIVAFNAIFQRYSLEIDGHRPQVGDCLFDFESRFNINEIKALVERALAGESVRVYKSVTDRQGRGITHDIHFEPVKNEAGDIWGVVITTLDVTVQEQVRLKLEQSETNLQALLDNSPDIIWSVDRDYKILTINEGFNRYLESHGFPRLKPGDRILDPFPEWVQQFWVGMYQRAFGGATFTEELSSEWQGQTIHLELRLSPIVQGGDQITGAVVLMRVINDRKALEQELIEAKEQAELANAVKSRFLAHISHELRNPVHAILGFVGLLRQQSAQPIYDLLARAARRLNDSLENLLDYNVLESGEMRLQALDFDLEQLLNDCAVLYVFNASQKGLAFETYIPPLPHRWVLGDRVRLQRILDSLVDNAIKFTATGTIRLSIRQQQVDDGSLVLHIHLADTGEGMPPELVQHIYEPFVQADSSTTKRVQGLGLGLTIVRQLVDLMGGHISIQSTMGVGTTIDLTLPFAPSARTSEEPLMQAPVPTPTQRPLRVLLAEDDEANAHYLQELLQGLGWSVRWVLNGRQVLRLLDREPYDVLILDGAMPVMDGIETTERIRELQRQNPDYPLIPIIVVTGYARGPERDRFLQLGVDAFLTKPVQPHDLVAAILKAVGLPTA